MKQIIEVKDRSNVKRSLPRVRKSRDYAVQDVTPIVGPGARVVSAVVSVGAVSAVATELVVLPALAVAGFCAVALWSALGNVLSSTRAELGRSARVEELRRISEQEAPLGRLSGANNDSRSVNVSVDVRVCVEGRCKVNSS